MHLASSQCACKISTMYVYQHRIENIGLFEHTGGLAPLTIIEVPVVQC